MPPTNPTSSLRLPKRLRGLKEGQAVRHERFGPGVVVAQWGAFCGCLECTAVLGAGQVIQGAGRNGAPKPVSVCCKATVHVVSGDGIFDVRFNDGKTRAVNQCWLTRV